MILVIGGAFQGQLEYALTLCDNNRNKILSDVHLLIKEGVKEGLANDMIEAGILEKLQSDEISVLTSDEVGYGIVPMDPFERAYREAVGRVMCSLAKKADAVFRCCAGVPVKIK